MWPGRGVLLPAGVGALLVLVLRSLEIEIKQHQLRAMVVAEPPRPAAAAQAPPPTTTATTQWTFRRSAPDRQRLRLRLQGIPKAFAACGGTTQLCAEARDQFANVPAPLPPPARSCAVAGVGGDLLQASPGFL